ncbi:type II toxin-antitoxin system HicA family toxin [Salibacterium halotolerans]|uniref:Predicted RNA binding protein YcfA, dsRBD-like fold, HicA-like mRNA interferase family n=1 Tax=Salibacterium halotolerans TaxID=1884432 RepID=A0A1I5MQY2_9BACI|nr:type II toxin-antitoxin system HicA family toxin [Salibacterium halotolerans]SFP12022.1 Predicted RNA binding protein YcfA, dsRBD-like fold, HicA-like mRNA interferase family [Salibacterium halotolerans]
MKNYSSKEILKILEEDGWYITNIKGSHHQLKHHTKPGKVTLPHPKKQLPTGTVKSIFKQAGL